MSDDASKVVMTPPGRCSFPKLYQPESYKNDPTKPKYFSVALVYPPETDLSALIAAANASARSEWGDKLGKDFTYGDEAKIPSWIKPDHRPFSKDEDGNTVLRIKSKTKPGIVDGRRQEITEESGRLYAGCMIRATVHPHSYDNESKGTKFWMNNVQKTGDGEPFSGRTNAEDDFDEIEMADSLNDAEALFA